MKDNAITRDELLEQMKPLGNNPVVVLGPSGFAKNAIREARLVHNPTVIGLVPVTQSTGDVTSSQIQEVREALRVAKNRFSITYHQFVQRDSPISPQDFNLIKGEYDAVIDRAIELLGKL